MSRFLSNKVIISRGRKKLTNLIATRRPLILSTTAATGTPLDPDAQNFVNASGITDPTQIEAINNLTISLKNIGVWGKMLAVYPFVGGTADTHKYNLINPADTNAAHRLAYAGGITHSAGGMLPNGINGYANSNFNMLIHYSENLRGGQSLMINDNYIINNVTLGGGLANTTPISYWLIRTFTSANRVRLDSGNNNNEFASDILKGFCGYNRVDNSTGWAYGFSGSKSNVPSITAASYPSTNIFIGAFNSGGTPGGFSTRMTTFYAIYDALTEHEFEDFRAAAITYNTTLGRI
jgi:hypothetical protein